MLYFTIKAGECMNSINIYNLTRVSDNEDFAEYEYILSGRKDFQRTRIREKESLIILVRELIKAGAGLEDLDNYFYSYTIAHISKESDLLRISSNRKCILNIELKSEDVGEDRIKQQLVRNRYYLSPVTTNIYSYTFILDTNTLYRLELSDGAYTLVRADFTELVVDIRMIKKCMKYNIESLFKAKDYLISPVNAPERFARHQYFLTNQQEAMSRKFLNSLISNSEVRYYSIKGEAGTGKTLLLYDTVRKLPKELSKCIIHFGRRTPNIDILQNTISNTTIITSKEFVNEDNIKDYDYVLVDETQRMHDDQFEWLKECNAGRIIMFYDCDQVLSRHEQLRAMDKRIEELSEEKYFLSDKIRTNPELAEFVRNLFDLTKHGRGYEYDCVTIAYANSINEFKKLKAYYRAKQYIYIDYEKSYKDMNERYKTRQFNTYRYIGKEFDKVLTVIDGKFRYNEYGELVADVEDNNDDILEKLLYQGVTRARDKLCIIVLDNKEVFEKLLEMKSGINREYID